MKLLKTCKTLTRRKNEQKTHTDKGKVNKMNFKNIAATTLILANLFLPAALCESWIELPEKNYEPIPFVIEEQPETTIEQPPIKIAEPSEGVGRVAAYEGVTNDELEQLVVLMYLEGGAESNECVYCLASVCFNRYASGIWGETMTDVIYAPYEFEPAYLIADFDTYGNLIIEERLDEIRDIVWDVYMNGSTIPERVMFFRTDYYHTWDGAVDEFAVGNVYFSSSEWCEV